MTAAPTSRDGPGTWVRAPAPRSASTPAWPPSGPASASARTTGSASGLWPNVRVRMDRCIAHLDMDAFYVSVELRRRPELRGLPVIVAGVGPRAVVTTASYEARRFGVGSAMPASRARRLCPDGVYLRPDFAYYRSASAEVMELVRGAADAVEVIGLDEAYLDLSGMPAPRAQMRSLVGAIQRRTGLAGSIGIGPSKLVAKV